MINGQDASRGESVAGRWHAAIIRRHCILHEAVATNRIIPPTQEQLAAGPSGQEAADARDLKQKQERKMRDVIWTGSVAQITVGAIAVLVVCYLAKLVLVTLLVSVLIAFMLEPIVSWLQRLHVPRAAGALVAVLLLSGAVWAGSYFFYNRAVSFIHELPKYTEKIRDMLSPVTQQTRDIKQTTEKILPADSEKSNKAVPVKVEGPSGPEFITRNLGTVTEVVLTVAFVPFLVYFMLSWQEHARSKTVQLFNPELRSTAYVTLGQISLMMRSFIAGNFIIGIFMSVASMVVFAFLGLPYFYFLGFISGFLSLMPYLGVVLAAVPPLAAGLGTLNETGIFVVIVTVLGLHLFSMNVLYPKVIGGRLQLNPLVVTIALLIWGWIWGALGLVLAVPIMGTLKIICDHVPSMRQLGEWMGE